MLRVPYKPPEDLGGLAGSARDFPPYTYILQLGTRRQAEFRLLCWMPDTSRARSTNLLAPTRWWLGPPPPEHLIQLFLRGKWRWFSSVDEACQELVKLIMGNGAIGMILFRGAEEDHPFKCEHRGKAHRGD
jgi:hypothetical protein